MAKNLGNNFGISTNTLRRSIETFGSSVTTVLVKNETETSRLVKMSTREAHVEQFRTLIWRDLPFSEKPFFLDQINFSNTIKFLEKRISENVSRILEERNFDFISVHTVRTGTMISHQNEIVLLENSLFSNKAKMLVFMNDELREFEQRGIFNFNQLELLGKTINV